MLICLEASLCQLLKQVIVHAGGQLEAEGDDFTSSLM